MCRHECRMQVFFFPFMTLARLFVEIKIYECDNDPCKMPLALVEVGKKEFSRYFFFFF